MHGMWGGGRLAGDTFSTRKEAEEAESYECAVCVRLRLLEEGTERAAREEREE